MIKYILYFVIGDLFVLTKLITIHPGISNYSYGYETSQLSRFKIANYLGLDYSHILTSPQLQNMYWKTKYVDFGFPIESVVSIPNWFSDCGHDSLSVKFSDLEDRFKDGELFFEGDFVSQVQLEGSTWYFTSCPYLERTSEGVLIWYNRDGSIVMKAKYFDIDKEPTPVTLLGSDYLYFKDGTWLTSEDLLIQYLIANVNTTDLIIRDQHQIPYLKLWRFVEFKSLNYFEYIHHNVFIDPCANLRKKTKYLVASEVLTEQLKEQGYQVTFCPPIFVDLDGKGSFAFVQTNPTDFCFVGNMSENKRVDWVISVFKVLNETHPHLKLNLYGTLDELDDCSLTDNIKYHGFQTSVPYKENQVYISCSNTELFANACVEALSNGLVALLSDVDIAHRYYNQNISSVKLFQTKEDLKRLIVLISEQTIETKDGVHFVQTNYGLDIVSKLYTDLFKRKGLHL